MDNARKVAHGASTTIDDAEVAHGKSGPALVSSADHHDGLNRVLAVEDRLRSSQTESELMHVIANELRDVVGARQAFVFRSRGTRNWRVRCISSMATIEPDAPLVRAIERCVKDRSPDLQAGKSAVFALDAPSESDADVISLYPFREAIWMSLSLRRGTVFAGVLFLRERPWDEGAQALLCREGAVVSDIWCAIAGRRPLGARPRVRRWLPGLIAIAMIGAMALPVPMSTIAPVQIVPERPHLVTAPIGGVIEKVHVDPNRRVKRGQALVQFTDTDFRNAYKLAQREADVAVARYRQLSQAAFSDEPSRRQVAIAETEMRLRISERDYARERLNRTIIKAEQDGLLIYADKNTLLGRPVSVGERLMQIADPAAVAGQVSLPVSDAIVLKRGASVRLFLDADPTRILHAHVHSESYHADVDATGVLVYRVNVRFSQSEVVPRIGSRGTAQLIGDHVRLGFFLFRRPIAWVRQNFGL